MGKASGLIRGPRSGSLPEKSEQQQQQPADSAPYTTFTRIPGPTNDVNGTVDESTIASSGMNGAVTQDVITTSTEKITRATSSTLVVATTPAPSSLDVFWPIWSDITTELASTVAITTTVGAGAKETSSVSLPSNHVNSFWDTTPLTPSSPIPATKIATPTTMTTEPTEVECLYGRAATPESHRHRGDGDLAQGSDDRLLQNNPCLPSPSAAEKEGSRSSGRSSASTSGPAWWNTIPSLPPLLQWVQNMMVTLAVIYAFVKEVLACARSTHSVNPGMAIVIKTMRKVTRRTRTRLLKPKGNHVYKCD